MAVASFEVFCEDLCALMGVDAPSLEPSLTGTVAFTVEYKGASVGFIKPRASQEAGVLMMMRFGAPPEGLEPDVLRVLMESNFLMMGMHAPAYARNPVNREISLHYSFSLQQADVHTIAGAIEKAAEMTEHWRLTYFLEVPNELLEGPESMGAAFAAS